MDKYLVTREEIEQSEWTQKQHYLNQDAVRTYLSLGDQVGLSGFGIHLVKLEPGVDSTELHTHYHEDECIYILSGEAIATVGDEEYTVSAGDFIGYRKNGLPHKLTGSGQETVTFLVVGQRLSHDVCDYPRINKRLFRNQDMNWNLADASELEEPEIGRKK